MCVVVQALNVRVGEQVAARQVLVEVSASRTLTPTLSQREREEYNPTHSRSNRPE